MSVSLSVCVSARARVCARVGVFACDLSVCMCACVCARARATHAFMWEIPHSSVLFVVVVVISYVFCCHAYRVLLLFQLSCDFV